MPSSFSFHTPRNWLVLCNMYCCFTNKSLERDGGVREREKEGGTEWAMEGEDAGEGERD